MCGIIGATGQPQVLDVLIDGLHRLEYRGYDSAGVAVVAGDGLWRARAAAGRDTGAGSPVAQLAERIAAGEGGTGPGAATAGIGHTRWATHGRPSEPNAHPHLDCTGRLALVHNGIIENHTELAAELAAAGHRFVSETDSEVLVHLVEQELAGGADLYDALRAALGKVRGAFAVVAVSADEPDRIVAARRAAPLVVGLGEG